MAMNYTVNSVAADDWIKSLPGHENEIDIIRNAAGHEFVRITESDSSFEELKQLPIDDESKANLLNIRINLFFNDSDSLMDQLYNGQISIGAWEESMKSLIREVHTAGAAIGKGGWENMTSQDWGRLGTPLRKQYAFLHNFANYISENRDDVSLAQLKARARLYGKAAGGSAAIIEAPFPIYDRLPWIPRDGSTECLVGCKCRWELDEYGDDGQNKFVRAVWHLSDAEHCATCVSRAGHTVTFQVRSSDEVPSIIGGF